MSLLARGESEDLNVHAPERISGHFSKPEAMTLSVWPNSNSGNYILLLEFALLFPLGTFFFFLPFQKKGTEILVEFASIADRRKGRALSYNRNVLTG